MADIQVGQWRKYIGQRKFFLIKILRAESTVMNNVHGFRVFENGSIDKGYYTFAFNDTDNLPIVTLKDLLNLPSSDISTVLPQIKEILEWLSLELRPAQGALFA